MFPIYGIIEPEIYITSPKVLEFISGKNGKPSISGKIEGYVLDDSLTKEVTIQLDEDTPITIKTVFDEK